MNNLTKITIFSIVIAILLAFTFYFLINKNESIQIYNSPNEKFQFEVPEGNWKLESEAKENNKEKTNFQLLNESEGISISFYGVERTKTENITGGGGIVRTFDEKQSEDVYLGEIQNQDVYLRTNDIGRYVVYQDIDGKLTNFLNILGFDNENYIIISFSVKDKQDIDIVKDILKSLKNR